MKRPSEIMNDIFQELVDGSKMRKSYEWDGFLKCEKATQKREIKLTHVVSNTLPSGINETYEEDDEKKEQHICWAEAEGVLCSGWAKPVYELYWPCTEDEKEPRIKAEYERRNEENETKLKDIPTALLHVFGLEDRYIPLLWGIKFLVPQQPLLDAFKKSEETFLNDLSECSQIHLQTPYFELQIPGEKIEREKEFWKFEKVFSMTRKKSQYTCIKQFEKEQQEFEKFFSVVKKHEHDIAEVCRHLEELKYRQTQN